MNLSRLAIATALCFAALTPVHAAPLLLDDKVNVIDNSGGVFTSTTRTNGLSSAVTIRINGRTRSADAGLFVLDHRPADAVNASWTEFLSFCLEPDADLTPFDNPYHAKKLQGAGYGAVALISELWGRYFGDVTTDRAAAAFQVALWELAVDGDDKNLGSGDFRLVANQQNSVMETATQWLTSLDGTGPKAQGLLVLVDKQSGRNGPNRQDLLTQVPVNDVPEPGMLALLGVALAGLSLSRRARKAA